MMDYETFQVYYKLTYLVIVNAMIGINELKRQGNIKYERLQ